MLEWRQFAANYTNDNPEITQNAGEAIASAGAAGLRRAGHEFTWLRFFNEPSDHRDHKHVRDNNGFDHALPLLTVRYRQAPCHMSTTILRQCKVATPCTE